MKVRAGRACRSPCFPCLRTLEQELRGTRKGGGGCTAYLQVLDLPNQTPRGVVLLLNNIREALTRGLKLGVHTKVTPVKQATTKSEGNGIGWPSLGPWVRLVHKEAKA